MAELRCNVLPRGRQNREYTYVGAAPFSGVLSGKPSLCMLTGVCAVSSARMNEGWLSEDACREGISIGIPFIPFILDRLMGREKLNAGLGNLVPPTDISEQIEGDLGACVVGEMGEFERPLAVEGFRLGEIVTPIVEV
jgi:hypothetical protein